MVKRSDSLTIAEDNADTHSAVIEVRDLTMAYGTNVIQQNLNFSVQRGAVFIIIGGNGSGKSTLLRHLVGLKQPAAGKVYYTGESYWDATAAQQDQLKQRFGMLYQNQHGALWSSLTLAENVALPLQTFTKLNKSDVADIVALKLALVGLAGFEQYYPSQLSGGMARRAGLARAIALDPDILYFDEPSAGLDPLNAKRLDELILELRDNLGTTVVVVTHDLASMFAIGDEAIFLDVERKTITARGDPNQLREHAEDKQVREFLNRGADQRP